MPSERHNRSASAGEDKAAADRQSQSSASAGPKVWKSEEIFGNEVEVFIAHEDQLYRLRQTRNGKLILCK